jgi:hypothetical protein
MHCQIALSKQTCKQPLATNIGGGWDKQLSVLCQSISDAKNLDDVSDAKTFNDVSDAKTFNDASDAKKLNDVSDANKFNDVSDANKFNDVSDTNKFNDVSDAKMFKNDSDAKKFYDALTPGAFEGDDRDWLAGKSCCRRVNTEKR